MLRRSLLAAAVLATLLVTAGTASSTESVPLLVLDVSWSPCGAAERGVHGVQQGREIEIVAVDLTARLRNITRSPGVDTSPAIAPDGRIAFVSTRDGPADVYVMSPAGRNVNRVTTSPLASPGTPVASVASNEAGTTNVGWSPDGRRLAFDAQNIGVSSGCTRNCVSWQVNVVGASGAGLRRLTGDGRSPTWSPDDTRIAFWAGVNTRDDTRWLVISRLDGSVVARLRAFAPVSSPGPAWSPDGKRIAFDARTSLEKPRRVVVLDADGTGRRTIATGHDPSWSGDSRRVAFIQNGRLYTIDRTGRNRRRVSRLGEVVLASAWSPNGPTLAFVASSPPNPSGFEAPVLRLATVRADGGRERTLAALSPDAEVRSGPVWSPSGRRVLLTIQKSGG